MPKQKIRIRSVTYVYDPDAVERWFDLIANEILDELKTNEDLETHTDEDEGVDM